MRRLTAIFVLLAVMVPAGVAEADPFTVVNTEDSGNGSLRAAIQGAASRVGADVITIDASGTIALESALPIVEDDLAINGPGAGSLTVEPAGATGFRIFTFGDGITASLSGLAVKGGTSQEGGGVRAGNGSLTLTRVVISGNEARTEGGTEVKAEGGGVFSEGSLTVRESVIRDNSAVALAGTMSNYARGGGILAEGPVTIDRSTISGNVAEAHGEGGKQSGALGGGLRVTGAPALVERSTVSGNSAAASNSLTNEARGGGLQGVDLNLTSSTVAGNSLLAGNGGFAAGANVEFTGTTLIRDTIVADPIGGADSCGGPEGSGGFNLDEDGSCGFGESTDLSGVIVGLEPLADNGGPTPTRALRADSAALDRGNAFGSSVDQRGLPRPSDFAAISNTEGGDGSDVGAFELQVPPPATGASGRPVVVTEVPTDRTPPRTRIVRGPPRVTFKRTAEFRFASSEAQSRFQCRLDKKKWHRCASPYRPTVKPGKHVFRVRAIDRFGNVDPLPARFGWRVKPLG